MYESEYEYDECHSAGGSKIQALVIALVLSGVVASGILAILLTHLPERQVSSDRIATKPRVTPSVSQHADRTGSGGAGIAWLAVSDGNVSSAGFFGFSMGMLALAISICLVGLAIEIVGMIWLVRDAQQQGLPAALWGLLFFLCPIPVLLIYLCLIRRPASLYRVD